MRRARPTLTALLFAIMALVAHAGRDAAAREQVGPAQVCIATAPAYSSDLERAQAPTVLRGALQPGPRDSAESDDVMIVFDLNFKDTY